MSIAASVIDMLIGEYIEGLDQQQLELDVLNGHLLLQNISIKQTALQALQLPVLVKAGLIGKVELRIPWSHLKSEPTKLLLDNVLLLVCPQSEAAWDEEEDLKREALRKEALLLSHERGAATAERESAKPQRKTWVASLSAMVLDRLQVEITNVVVRYVDASHGACPYSLSLAVESISMRTSEERPDSAEQKPITNGRTAGLSGEERRAASIHKVIHIVGLTLTCAKSQKAAPPLHGFSDIASPAAAEGSKRQGDRRSPRHRRTSRRRSGGSNKSASTHADSHPRDSSSAECSSQQPHDAPSSSAFPHEHDSAAGCIDPLRFDASLSQNSLPALPGASRLPNESTAGTAGLDCSVDTSSSDESDDISYPDMLMSLATSLPEWLVAAVGAYHDEALRNGGQLLEPTTAVIELSRIPPPPAAAGVSPHEHVAALRVVNLNVVVSPEQLCLLSSATSYFVSSQQFELWRRFRPPDGERPSTGASARRWWQQLGLAVLDEMRRRRPRFDWSMLQARREERKRYVQLYRDRLRLSRVRSRLPESDRRELLHLEQVLPVEITLFYRQLAESWERAERLQRESQEVSEMLSLASRAAAWIGRLRGRSEQPSEQPARDSVLGPAIATAEGGDEHEPEAVLKRFNLDSKQRELLADLLRQAAAGCGPDQTMSMKGTLALFQVAITLKEPAKEPGCDGAMSAKGAAAAAGHSVDDGAQRDRASCGGGIKGAGIFNSANECRPSPTLWLACDLQRVTFDMDIQNGGVDSCLRCDQLQIFDRAPGAAPEHVVVVSKELQLQAVDDLRMPKPAAGQMHSVAGGGTESDGDSACVSPAVLIATTPASPQAARSPQRHHSFTDRSTSHGDSNGASPRYDRASAIDLERSREGASPHEFGRSSHTLRRTHSLPRHRRRTSYVGDPLVMRRAPIVLINVSRAANSRTWKCTVKAAPLQGTISMALLEMAGVALAGLSSGPPPIGAYVEAALRIARAESRAGECPNVPCSRVPCNGAWLNDLVDRLIALRAPTAFSSLAGAPLLEGMTLLDDFAAGARFSLVLPSLRLAIPELRHSSDCNSAQLKLGGLSIEGVVMDKARFKCGMRIALDSVSMEVQPAGCKRPIVVMPPTQLMRGTVASLAAHSPGYENSKILCQFSAPALVLRLCPSVFGAITRLQGNSHFDIYDLLPPWQQEPVALNELNLDVDNFRLVLFDETPPTDLPKEPAPGWEQSWVLANAAKKTNAAKDAKATQIGASWQGNDPRAPECALPRLVESTCRAASSPSGGCSGVGCSSGVGGIAGANGYENLGFVPLASGGALATLSLSRLSLSLTTRKHELRLRVHSDGCVVQMDHDAPPRPGTRRHVSMDTVCDVKPTLGSACEPGSARPVLQPARRTAKRTAVKRAPGTLLYSDLAKNPTRASALRISVQYDLCPTADAQHLKCVLLELGETFMVWDTASTHRLFSHCYRHLANAYLPVPPCGPDAAVGDPFHIHKVRELWYRRDKACEKACARGERMGSSLNAWRATALRAC